MKIKIGEYTGFSELGINEAIQNALQKASEYIRVEVIETQSSWISEEKRSYQVIVSTFAN
jgi:flavin-binding protein dodecin